MSSSLSFCMYMLYSSTGLNDSIAWFLSAVRMLCSKECHAFGLSVEMGGRASANSPELPTCDRS